MSWIDEELERKRKENAGRAASLSDQETRTNRIASGVAGIWENLLSVITNDIGKFNSLSDRKADTRVSAAQVDVRWRGKALSLLSVQLDSEKFVIVYTQPTEPPKKLKIVLNEFSDPYLWDKEKGQLTIEQASELLLKPILFP